MSHIVITSQGLVSGSRDALVDAAADVLRALPSPAKPGDLSDSRMDALVAAVRIPWTRVPVEAVSAA